MANPRQRVVIEKVEPEIDCGRYPIKRVVGEKVVVEADIFAEGHDELACAVLHRPAGAEGWSEVPMQLVVNDRWRGEFEVCELGTHVYTVTGWVDEFHTWARDLNRRLDAGQDVTVDLMNGAALVRAAARRAGPGDSAALRAAAAALTGRQGARMALSAGLAELMARNPDRRFASRYELELEVTVDRKLAAFSAWYEMFPRSASPDPGRAGTLKDVEARLPYVAGLGFDVLYLPPIHPIGRAYRKGANNTVVSEPGDPGSPWAIGGPEGGHKSIHPELGTVADFRRLVAAARRQGLEVALDIAFQASPDHPYVGEHPEWFRKRPDGSIQYAENPPKKYQDIYPFNFDTGAWRSLWDELKSVFDFWIDQGVRIFRVDNPHTKPFAFWEWVIPEIKARHPDVILLSEAFTRPKVMHRLAKLGFTQSYTYFAWRNEGWELKEYMTELTRTEVREFFRPNFWPNTPDILTEGVQTGGWAGSAIRFVLAATLVANYGIYGPVFELVETEPLVRGREDYMRSEKYEVRQWDLDAPKKRSLQGLITRVNRIRRQHPALQQDRTLRFLDTDNERLLAYAKTSPDRADTVVTVVNLDPGWKQSGWVDVPVEPAGGTTTFAAVDLLTDRAFTWLAGGWNYVELDPAREPAHILSIDRPLRPEV